MEFAIEIVELSNQMMENQEYTISKQIRKSGTSIGANVRESKYAQSKADFVSKLQIALKEAAETDFWLELMCRTNYISRQSYAHLSDQCHQIIAILTASINTSITSLKN